MLEPSQVRFWLTPLTLLACIAVSAPAMAQPPQVSHPQYEWIKAGYRSHGFYGGRHYKRYPGYQFGRHHRQFYPFGQGRHYYRYDRFYGDYYRRYRFQPYGLYFRYDGRRYGFDYSPFQGFGLYFKLR